VTPQFREAFEAMKAAADALIVVNTQIKRMGDAMLAANDDHEDLREHVVRLEGMILNLTAEVRQLREGRS
jgi:hypothetical protein